MTYHCRLLGHVSGMPTIVSRQNDDLHCQPTMMGCDVLECAYDCAQHQYTIQHRTVLIISPVTPLDSHHSSDVVYWRKRGKNSRRSRTTIVGCQQHAETTSVTTGVVSVASSWSETGTLYGPFLQPPQHRQVFSDEPSCHLCYCISPVLFLQRNNINSLS